MKQWFILTISKYFIFLYISIAQLSYAVIFALTYVLIYSVDGAEAMTQWSEAMNTSSLQFFRSVKCFIASIFTQQLTLHQCYFLKENHPLTPHCCSFFKRDSSLNASANAFKVTLPTSAPATPSPPARVHGLFLSIKSLEWRHIDVINICSYAI